LFNIFIDDYISKSNILAPAVGKTSIPGPLFADDVAICSVTITELEKGTDNLTKYYKDWSLKCKLKRPKY
jgi:hypothetical protein